MVAPEMIQNGEARLIGSSHHHLTVVLRLKPGSTVDLLDGSGGRHEGILAEVTSEESVVRIQRSSTVEPTPGPHLWLLYGLSRGRRTELVLQKATELGIDAIFPCLCERSVARPQKPEQKHQRWAEIIAQAARQCDRARLPWLAPLTPLAQALEAVPASAVRLMAVPGAAPLSTLAGALAGAPSVALVVGPEGGFAAGEVEAAVNLGFVGVGLGPQVLRTETAAVALVALTAFLSGRLE